MNLKNELLTGLTPALQASQNHGSVLAEDCELSTDSVSLTP